ncbi:hypothetical protein [uncultured Arcobacter sp.]|uniref:hypothetical protein n=1 Tax=uncultured Arcobacter sp. TaxID=165434 RepID=UPI0026231712|nr:hypothetical protein [uncultured Arcobacter sp.]
MAYTTVADVSNELKGLTLNSSTTPTSTVVSGWIDESDSQIDLKTGKVWSSTLATSTYLDYNGSGVLYLPHAPVNAVTELKYEVNGLGADSASWSTLTEGRTGNFILYGDEGEIKFFGNNYPSAGYQNICVTYNYGYITTPDYIKRLSTLMSAQRVIQATVNSMSQEEGGSVTVGNISITDPDTFSLDTVNSINNEIKMILDELGGNARVFRNTRRY